MHSKQAAGPLSKQAVPVVDFYDDAESWPTSELIHSEPLAERSQRHGWRIHPHRHDKLTQLFFLHSGSGNARIDSAPYTVLAPCVLVIPENSVHEFKWEKNSAGFVLSITSTLITELLRQLGMRGNVFAKHTIVDAIEDAAYVETLFRRIQEEYVEPLALQELSLDYLVKLLALWLVRNSTAELEGDGPPNRASLHFGRFKNLVDKHHKLHWPISKYADAIGITPSHLNAVCRTSADQSALAVVHERLLLAARRNLVYTEKTIAGVSHSLGFADTSYFTRFFKKNTGLPPGQYRRQSGTYFAGPAGRKTPATL